MTIDAQGWISWALDSWGPDHKVNGGRNGLLGLVAHSAEGNESGLLSVLHGPRQASWHLSCLTDGRVLQHYSLLHQTWASGAGFPNNNLVSMESEGKAGEPLTAAQVATIVRFLKDFANYTGRRDLVRHPKDWMAGDLVLVEHKECTRWGGPATACPSGRYPWDAIIDQYNGIPEAPELPWEDALWAAVAVAQHYRVGTAPHPYDMERAVQLIENMRRK